MQDLNALVNGLKFSAHFGDLFVLLDSTHNILFQLVNGIVDFPFRFGWTIFILEPLKLWIILSNQLKA